MFKCCLCGCDQFDASCDVNGPPAARKQREVVFYRGMNVLRMRARGWATRFDATNRDVNGPPVERASALQRGSTRRSTRIIEIIFVF